MNLARAIAQQVIFAINGLHRWLYRVGLRRARRLPRPVISVGNRSMGGSGKTPTTIAVAELLTADGIRPAILSRGYGRSSGESWLVVDREDPARYGDEPSMMFQRLGGRVPILVGSNRAAAAEAWLERGETADVFLLDDGFQHLALHRDLDIVLESEAEWFRESPAALAHADLIIERYASPEEREDLAEPGALTAVLAPVALVRNSQRSDLSALEGRRVLAFSGLANNESFYDLLHRLGVVVRQFVEFPDHHFYDEEEVRSLLEKARNQRAEMVLTTEKDWVKVREIDDSIAYLETSMHVEPTDRFRNAVVSVVRSASQAQAG